MNQELSDIAKALVAPTKGILAADESLPTIEKRLKAVGLESTEEIRRVYRELLFTTSGIEEFLSGVIMFDETMHQSVQGKPFPQILQEKGIIPGVKVDKGTIDLPNFPEEKFTQGLDDLGERLEGYKKLGAKFTKWRAVYTLGARTPTQTLIEANSEILALYASISQARGLLPIVEPEVLMNGSHNIQRCSEVTAAVLKNVFFRLGEHKVDLTGTLLKPNMVLPGEEAQEALPEEVAQATLDTLKRSVPEKVSGIVFLSGGQTPEEACANLNAISKLGGPWQLSFSFGRALQDTVIKTWAGNSARVELAQKEFLKRARLASYARQGKYV